MGSFSVLALGWDGGRFGAGGGVERCLFGSSLILSLLVLYLRQFQRFIWILIPLRVISLGS